MVAKGMAKDETFMIHISRKFSSTTVKKLRFSISNRISWCLPHAGEADGKAPCASPRPSRRKALAGPI
jgi:hypothetical protein